MKSWLPMALILTGCSPEPKRLVPVVDYSSAEPKSVGYETISDKSYPPNLKVRQEDGRIVEFYIWPESDKARSCLSPRCK